MPAHSVPSLHIRNIAKQIVVNYVVGSNCTALYSFLKIPLSNVSVYDHHHERGNVWEDGAC